MNTLRVGVVAAVALAGLASACATQQQQGNGMNTLSSAEHAAGWRLLFDGKTTNGWRGYMKPTMPAGWEVIDGALTRVSAGGDIVTTEKFKNFDLMLEWRLDPNSARPSNSGIFFHAIEGPEAIYYSAPEVQILDNDKHPDGKSEMTAAGSNFALHPAPKDAVRPMGQWNQVRLLVNGSHVEHWLNGRKIVEYELWSPEWKALVAKSKFNEWKEYGQSPDGYIGLQEHGSYVAFRSIRIRVLP